jgi:diamine N-acetyltransferase
MSPEMRSARPDDMDQALQFVNEYYVYDGIDSDAGRVRAGLLQLLENPAFGQFWFVQDQGQAVGHVVLTYGFDLEFGGRTATVTEIFLRESHRGRGFGHAIFAFLDDHCASQNVLVLELQAEHENIRAQGFYRQLGFHAHDRIPFSRPVVRRGAQ